MSYCDYSKYYNPKDTEQFELFIGPDGEYYKVKTTYESDLNCTHYNWAKGYIEENDLTYMYDYEVCKANKFTPLQVLIHGLGFIRYTHAGLRKPIFTFPNRLYFGQTISDRQLDSIYRLIYYNNDIISEEFVKEIENSVGEYEQKRDHVFKNLT